MLYWEDIVNSDMQNPHLAQGHQDIVSRKQSSIENNGALLRLLLLSWGRGERSRTLTTFTTDPRRHSVGGGAPFRRCGENDSPEGLVGIHMGAHACAGSLFRGQRYHHQDDDDDDDA